jgi:undecaprenyl diphosphate synthase
MSGSVSKRAAEAGAAETGPVSGKASLVGNAPVAGNIGAHGVRHLAIIMDGNGRWATKRGFPRVAGHRAGLEAVRRLVKAAIARGIGYLTIYSFSTENWTRPAEEVGELMSLLKFFIRADLSALDRQNVRVRLIGEREGLAPDIRALLETAETTTHANTGLTFIVAFNYGARAEIARAP